MEEAIKLFEKEVSKEIKKTIKEISKRYNLEEEEAREYIMGVEKIKRKGRPKKEREEREKVGRGRPVKEEKKVIKKVGEDLISRLLEEAKNKM